MLSDTESSFIECICKDTIVTHFYSCNVSTDEASYLLVNEILQTYKKKIVWRKWYFRIPENESHIYMYPTCMIGKLKILISLVLCSSGTITTYLLWIIIHRRKLYSICRLLKLNTVRSDNPTCDSHFYIEF